MHKVHSPKQAAIFLGLCLSSVNNLKKQGKIPFIQISKGRIGFLESDLIAYIESNRVG